MLKTYKFRTALFFLVFWGVIYGTASLRAESTKDKVDAMQEQLNQLTSAVQRLQSTVDSKFGLLQHLVEQTADNANRMTTTVDALQQKINAQSEALGGKLDTSSGQMQSLNDSVDELKSRMSKLDKSIQDLQNQLQNVQNPSVGGGGQQPGAGASPMPAPGAGAQGVVPNGPGGGQAPPLQETYQAGLRDYNSARYEVAAGEFHDVLTYYPQDDLAGQRAVLPG